MLFMNTNGTVKSHQKISDTEGGFTGTLDNSDELGVSVAGLGDMDGDGVPDLAVGALGDDDGGENRGAVWVLYMNANGTVKSHQKISDTEGGFTGTLDDGDCFGEAVASLGDLDGDGGVEMVVHYNDEGGSGRGAVWVLDLGGDRPLPVELSVFTAMSSDGQVVLRWATESEMNNLGFHVYRALSEDGEYDRLTAELIAGAGNTTTEQTYHFTDIRVTNGVTYWYTLEDIAFDGTRTMHGPIAVTPQAKVEIVAARPDMYALSQCYPNPFNPSTTIRYQLPEPGNVRLTIYNQLGQEVRVLVSQMQPAGWYRVCWDGRDEAGQPVSSGAYLYRLEVAEEFLQTKKMVVVR